MVDSGWRVGSPRGDTVVDAPSPASTENPSLDEDKVHAAAMKA
eukprot:CAMPEP_0119007538 /NCGR_PEP_ID=MMETSP1176-20130426/3075_1 /TAXON_ID=265551 /ORGANISM="Synedropsis recta cf, Strain CCMP1620" /LENGTH=42 /DNA_ID= /DNA_START= /DNA_END= /DNA_ORIENTATION=